MGSTFLFGSTEHYCTNYQNKSTASPANLRLITHSKTMRRRDAGAWPGFLGGLDFLTDFEEFASPRINNFDLKLET
jgi:hypothetical protein